MTTKNRIVLDDGKYTVVNELSNGGNLRALRHGEEWRNLSGDGLVLAMYHEIEQLREDADSTFEQILAAEVALESSRAEVERLQKALEFYAHKSTWENGEYCTPEGDRYDDAPPFIYDMGAKAREAMQNDNEA